MKKSLRYLVEIVWCAVILVGAVVGAEAGQTNKWTFLSAGDYEVSDDELVKVRNGAAELALLSEQIVDGELGGYRTNALVVQNLSMGADVGLRLAFTGTKFVQSGSYVSAPLQNPAGNILNKIVVRATDVALANAGGGVSAATDSSLVALWRMDNNGADSSGLGYALSGSLSFSTDAVVGTHSKNWGACKASTLPIVGKRNVTIVFWAKAQSNPDASDLSIALTLVASAPAFCVRLGGGVDYPHTAKQAISVFSSENNTGASANPGTWTASDNGVWHHIAVVLNNGAIALYKDATSLPLRAQTWSGAIPSYSETVVGALSSGGSYAFIGAVDDVAVLNKAMSATEVFELYKRPRSLFVQVRSADAEAALGGKAFVGPDNTTNTYYRGEGDALVTGTDFRIWDPYVQYKAVFYGTAAGAQSPYLDAAVFLGTMATLADDSYGTMSRGACSNVTIFPTIFDAPRMQLSRMANGGFVKHGTYTSRVFDGGSPVYWYALRWTVPVGTGTDDSGLVGLWTCDGAWTDLSASGKNGVSTDVVYDAAKAKFGSHASVFNGRTAKVDLGNLSTTKAKTLEFWLWDDNPDDAVVSFNATSRLMIVNGQLTAVGLGAPNLFINGSSRSRALQPGWNHVVLSTEATLPLSSVVFGSVGTVFMNGLVDNVATYNRTMQGVEAKGKFMQGIRVAAGRVRFQIRAGNELPLTGPFVGPADSDALYITDNKAAAGNLPGSAVNKRYIQYRAYFDGDGAFTPALGSVSVQVFGGDSLYQRTATDFVTGTYDDSTTAWVGDELRLQDVAVAPGLADMNPAEWPGLEGLWHFEEDVWGPGPAVIDSSFSASHHGQAQGGVAPSFFAQVGNKCAKLDGVNDYIVLPGIPMEDDFSIAMWLQTTSPSRMGVMSLASGAFVLELNSDGTGVATGKLAVTVNDGSKAVTAVANAAPLNNGAWQHVCVIREGDMLYLYVNGAQSCCVLLGSSFGSLGTGELYLGKAGAGVSYFGGNIDELAFFTAALGEGAVRASLAVGASIRDTGLYVSKAYDAGRPAIWDIMSWRASGVYARPLDAGSEGLVALWHFDELTGGTCSDASGNNNHGSGAGARGAGVSSNCVSFVGSGVVSVPDSAILQPSAVTVEAWVKARRPYDSVFVSKRTPALGYRLGVDADGRPYFWVAGTFCRAVIGIRTGGAWTHLAGTYDGAQIRLFVDGLIAGVATKVAAGMEAGAMTIGGDVDGTGYADADIDEIAIHNRALPGVELFDHAGAWKARLGTQARSGDSEDLSGIRFVGPGGVTNTYFRDAQGANMFGSIPLGRYFQYQMRVSTIDGAFDPRFGGATLNHSGYPTDKPWVSPGPSAGLPFLGRLLSFAHTIKTNTADKFRYQISGTGTNWYYWNGDIWEEDTLGVGWSFANALEGVNDNIYSFYDQLYDKVGGTFFFRAFLDSAGNDPTALDDISVSYSVGRITVGVPNGTENGDDALVSRITYPISWTWAGTVGATLKIEYSLDGPEGPWVFEADVPKGANGSNTYSWVTPSLAARLDQDQTNCYVRVRDPNDDTIYDLSDNGFSIVYRFRLVKPNGGEKWYVGQTNLIRWVAPYDIATLARLDFAEDGSNYVHWVGSTFVPNRDESTNEYAWATPTDDPVLLSTNARIRVATPGQSGIDATDGFFTMAGVSIVAPPASVNGERARIQEGQPYELKWKSIQAGAKLAIDFSPDSGQTWTNMLNNVPNQDGTNSYIWSVTQTGTDTAMLRFRSLSDPNIVSVSALFRLANIKIIKPEVNAVWLMQSIQTIEWVSGGAGDYVNIHFSTNDGAAWILIEDEYPNQGTYDWTVSDLVSQNARIRVQSFVDTNLKANSERFNIAGVRVRYPDTATDTINVRSSYWMIHDAAPRSWKGAKLELSYDEGATWGSLGTSAENWPIGTPYQFTPWYPADKAARIRVTANDTPGFTNIVQDISDQPFTIAGIRIMAPTNKTLFTIGDLAQIRWLSAGTGSKCDVLYSDDDGKNYVTLQQNYGNLLGFPGGQENAYGWSIPPQTLPSLKARVKIKAGSFEHISEQFMVRGVRMKMPAAGATWDIGSSQWLQWQHAGIDKTARGTLSVSLDGGRTFPSVLAASYAFVDIDNYNWIIPGETDPTTNAVIRLTVDSSDVPVDVGMVFYSDRFTLRGMEFVSPLGGENWELGTTNSISFLAAGMGAQATIHYSSRGGAPYDAVPVAAIPIQDGSNTFVWAIERTREPSTNSVIKVETSVGAKVSPRFTVGGIKVLRPIGNDIWAAGDSNLVRWLSVGTVGSHIIDLIYANGSTYTVKVNQPGESYGWLVGLAEIPNGDEESNVVLRVRDVGGFEGRSEPFKLVGAPRIEIVAPLKGQFWRIGETRPIKWLKGGQMSASDFRVAFSPDNFVSNVIPIVTPVTYQEEDNTFVVNWRVENYLGPFQIRITNVVNTAIGKVSDPFVLCGNLQIDYPDGGDLEDPVYAMKPTDISWGTKGAVSRVDLFYKLGPEGAWTKINAAPIANKYTPEGEVVAGALFSSYNWLPLPQETDKVKIRVQDHAYSNVVFDGVTPGPYDDSDEWFSINYYTVNWEVQYFDPTNARVLPLEHLRVADSSGWSQSDLSCVNTNKALKPIVRKYPYGTFSTTWMREGFQNFLDFQWNCGSNHTRQVWMTKGASPEYQVLANFAYDYEVNKFMIHAWLEQGGEFVTDPDRCQVLIYDESGALIENGVRSEDPQANGVFWLEWDVSATETRVGRAFNPSEVFFAKAVVTHAGHDYSAGMTFMLRLGASGSVVDEIRASLDVVKDEIIGNIGGVSSNIASLRTDVMIATSNLATTVEDSMSNVVSSIESVAGDMTNAVLPRLAEMTNELAVLRPSITNMEDWVESLRDSSDDDLARILYTETAVRQGSTNTILYKTKKGYGAGVVTIAISNTTQRLYFGAMDEVVSGIYQEQVVVDWAPGPCIVTCSDPNARDSLVLEVTKSDIETAPTMLSALSNSVAELDAKMTNVLDAVATLANVDLVTPLQELTDVTDGLRSLAGIDKEIAAIQDKVGGLDGADLFKLENMVSGIDAGSKQMQSLLSTLSSKMDANDIKALESKIQQVLSSVQGSDAKLQLVQSQLNTVGTSAKEAATAAALAKNQTMDVTTGLQQVLSSMSSDDVKIGELLGQLSGMKAMLSETSAQVTKIPEEMKASAWVQQLQHAAAEFNKVIDEKGIRGLVDKLELAVNRMLPKEDGKGGEAKAPTEKTLAELKAEMGDLKDSIAYVMQVVDEMRNEPVVDVDLLGAE